MERVWDRNLTAIKLVLSGSGTRFPAFVGAIKRLREEGYYVSEVTGTSGGAIIAAGLGSGYGVGELTNLCRDLLPQFNTFIDVSIFSLLFRKGLIRGKKIEKLFKNKFISTLGDTRIPIKIITVNYDKTSLEQPYTVFSSEDTPDISLAKAVRASMSLPLIFEPAKIRGDRHIDGGIAANFPVDIYGEEAKDVIGLYLKTDPPKRPQPSRWWFKGLVQYIFGIIDILMAAATVEHIEDAEYAKIIPLETKQKGLDFSMTKEQVDRMIQDGYDSVDRWFEGLREVNKE
jgi:NTE family protein